MPMADDFRQSLRRILLGIVKHPVHQTCVTPGKRSSPYGCGSAAVITQHRKAHQFGGQRSESYRSVEGAMLRAA